MVESEINQEANIDPKLDNINIYDPNEDEDPDAVINVDMLRLRIDDFSQDLIELTNAKTDMNRFRTVSINKYK